MTPPVTIGLGLAIGTGTDVAIETSEHMLVSGDLHAAADASRLPRAMLRASAGPSATTSLRCCWPPAAVLQPGADRQGR